MDQGLLLWPGQCKLLRTISTLSFLESINNKSLSCLATQILRTLVAWNRPFPYCFPQHGPAPVTFWAHKKRPNDVPASRKEYGIHRPSKHSSGSPARLPVDRVSLSAPGAIQSYSASAGEAAGGTGEDLKTQQPVASLFFTNHLHIVFMTVQCAPYHPHVRETGGCGPFPAAWPDEKFAALVRRKRRHGTSSCPHSTCLQGWRGMEYGRCMDAAPAQQRTHRSTVSHLGGTKPSDLQLPLDKSGV